MNERAIKLYGTEEPPPDQKLLTAGPVTATFEDGQLRWVRIGETEVIRAIAFLIRDRNWSTAIPEISDLKIDADRPPASTVTLHCALPNSRRYVRLARRIQRQPPTGRSAASASASPDGEDFQTGRTGFVILHPLAGFVGEQNRGRACRRHDRRRRAVPDEIVPDQPFLLVRAITPRAGAGRHGGHPDGRRFLGDRGPPQLDRRLVQDLLPAAVAALALHHRRPARRSAIPSR